MSVFTYEVEACGCYEWEVADVQSQAPLLEASFLPGLVRQCPAQQSFAEIVTNGLMMKIRDVLEPHQCDQAPSAYDLHMHLLQD